MAKKATHYSDTPIAEWNTGHFQAYLADKHVEHYGIQYVPAGGVVAERTLLAKHIGTARKAGMYGKDVIKRFIDRCYAAYKPTQQYPGLTFWFMVTWMSAELQRAELEGKRQEAVEQATENYSEVAEWL